MKELLIENRRIGIGHRPYIIAELSANHNGDINKALELIELAKESGADAIKLQTYTADTMTIKSAKPDFQIKGGLWNGYSLYDLYNEAHTPWSWHSKLFEKARELGITIFSTPFDESSVDFLEDLNVPAFKIASFEATDLPLIEYIATKNKPIILSTGMASKEEISEAVEVIKKYHDQLIVLHCVSGYPAPSDQYNLRTIQNISEEFNVISGLSDHTLGNVTAITSIALGACVIEKHFIKSRRDKGPDSEFSIEPSELKNLVDSTKIAWKALGQVDYSRKEVEKENLRFRRSIYIVKDIKSGEVFNEENIRRIRPGFGMLPKMYNAILGKKSKIDLEAGSPLKEEYILNE